MQKVLRFCSINRFRWIEAIKFLFLSLGWVLGSKKKVTVIVSGLTHMKFNFECFSANGWMNESVDRSVIIYHCLACVSIGGHVHSSFIFGYYCHFHRMNGQKMVNHNGHRQTEKKQTLFSMTMIIIIFSKIDCEHDDDDQLKKLSRKILAIIIIIDEIWIVYSIEDTFFDTNFSLYSM